MAEEHPSAAHSTLELLLEGRGWPVLCASVDFTFASIAVLVATRGMQRLSLEDSMWFVLPALFVALMFARGNYRSRLRVLILDDLPGLVTMVSVATMVVVRSISDQRTDNFLQWCGYGCRRCRNLHRQCARAHASLGAVARPMRQAGADPRSWTCRDPRRSPPRGAARVRIGSSRLYRR